MLFSVVFSVLSQTGAYCPRCGLIFVSSLVCVVLFIVGPLGLVSCVDSTCAFCLCKCLSRE